jgi:5,6-dimethylbenzimidazole synthase
LLRMPEGSRPVAVLCLGYVREFYPRPMLEMVEWARRFSLATLVHTDYWSDGADGSRTAENPGAAEISCAAENPAAPQSPAVADGAVN